MIFISYFFTDTKCCFILNKKDQSFIEFCFELKSINKLHDRLFDQIKIKME